MSRRKFGSKILSLALVMSMLVSAWGVVPMKADAEDVNIIAGKVPTTNASGEILNPEAATDGHIGNSSSDDYCTKVVAGSETGVQPGQGGDNGFSTWSPVYLQYDFDGVYDVSEIVIYRKSENNTNCTFHDVKVELSKSADFTDAEVVYEDDLVETSETRGTAQTLTLENSVEAQYIRITGKGYYMESTSGWVGYSSGVAFNEIQVMGVPASGTETKTLDSIEITTAPAKTTYTEGENFDATGMVVKANWSDSTQTDVTDKVTFKTDALAVNDTIVTVSYTYGGITKEAVQAITVKEESVDPDAPLKEINILKGITPTSNVEITRPDCATDGLIGGSDDDSNNTEIQAGTETGGDDNGYSNWDQVYLQYDFGKAYDVKSVKIYRNTFANAICDYMDVKVELSNDEDFEDPTTIFATATVKDTVDTKGDAQVITLDEKVNARYLRVYGKGQYIQNTNSSWKGYSNAVRFNEIQAFADVPEKMVVTNIMLGLEPSSNSEHMIAGDSFTVPTVQIKNPEAATDGIVGGSDDDANNTKIIAGEETGGSDNGQSGWDNVYLQYDFGKERKITEVKLYRNTYANAVSKFYETKVELSEDAEFTNPTVIYGPTDYEETVDTKGEPIVITLDEAVKAKYIRVWGKGHYIQNTNSNWKGNSNGVLFNEIQAFAKVPESELPSAPEDEAVNIAANKVPYVYGVVPENIEAITDGNVDDNYASIGSNSGAERWLQFEYRNQYAFKTINFKLEEGTYDSVKVSVSSSATGGGNVVFSENNFTQGEDMTSITLDSNNIGKYVRFTVKKSGSEATVDVKWSEIELWATGKNYDESKPEYVAPESKYDTLVWSDEFNGDAVDESKWTIIDGMANHGAIYNRGAVSIQKDGEDSYLAINSKNYETTDELIEAVGWDQYQNQTLASHVTWSSGRVESKNKFSFQFGRMAVRAKVNDTKGIWPAIWMLCQDETGHDEIDVLEYLGQDAWDAWTTNHFGILDYNKASHGVSTKNYEAWSQDFHVYEVEWDPQYITFYLDGVQVHRTTTARDDGRDGMHTRPMFAILETQVGDGWVGPVDYSKQNTKQDSDYLIDWVRVYQTEDQDVARFDDLAESNPDSASEGYVIEKIDASKDLVYLTDGTKQYEDKDNFYYGGQPRYEDERIAPGDVDGEQYLTYKVPGVKDVHLTTYYQTLSDFATWSDAAGSNKGKAITTTLQNGANLNFKIYTSEDNKTWTEFTSTNVVNNFPEAYPSYARLTVDAYGLPEGTNYVKIVFPEFDGITYTLNNGTVKDVVNTDIQLAKVTFLQKQDVSVTKEEDKTVPTFKFENTSGNPVVEREVKLVASEAIQCPGEGWTEVAGSEGKEWTKTFTKNTKIKNFTVTDLAGNESESQILDVKNVDSSLPTGEVTYSTTEPTNGNVTVTLKTNTDCKTPESWTKVNWREFTKVYEENTKEGFVLTSRTDVEGTEEVVVEVTNIDKTAPTAVVEYSTKEETTDSVVITITVNEKVTLSGEGWEVTETANQFQKSFDENVDEVVVLKDEAGNESEIEISVENIVESSEPSVPSVPVKPAKPNKPGFGNNWFENFWENLFGKQEEKPVEPEKPFDKIWKYIAGWWK